MPSLMIRAGSRRKVFQILDSEFTLGSGTGNALRLSSDAVRDRHLRFTREGDSYRVEPASTDAPLTINGRQVPARILQHGDQIALGGVRLAFWADGHPRPMVDDPESTPAASGLDLQIDVVPSAPSAPPGLRGPTRRDGPVKGRGRGGRTGASGADAGGRPEPARLARRRGMPRAAIWWNTILVTLVVGYLLFDHLGSKASPRRPEDLVTLADAQRARGDHEAALQTLDVARRDTTDPDLRAQIATRERLIRQDLQLRADLPVLNRAVLYLERIRQFVAMHLGEDPPSPRAAARELSRLTSAWLDEFRDVCDRHDREREMIAEVEDYARRHRAAAELGEPDRAEDVLFAAGRRTRFRPKRYPEAIRILEGWLAASPSDAPGRAEVEAQARGYRELGAEYAAAERASIDRMVGRGQTDAAIAALQDLIAEGALPEWLGDARELLARLEDRR